MTFQQLIDFQLSSLAFCSFFSRAMRKIGVHFPIITTRTATVLVRPATLYTTGNHMTFNFFYFQWLNEITPPFQKLPYFWQKNKA
jgi:hypothetical protein